MSLTFEVVEQTARIQTHPTSKSDL